MKVSSIISKISNVKVLGNDREIEFLSYNSKDVKPNSLFFCIEGTKVDGHKFAQQAVDNGACAVVIRKDIELKGEVTKIFVDNTREAMALMASNFYSNPASKLNLIGITGTNGKTTSTFIMKSILDIHGDKTALLGTIYNIIGEDINEAKRTTPESLDLQEMYSDMIDKKVDSCIMEVSSHSLELNRVYGVEFDISVFTNLSQDHLDFHVTMDNYFNSKMKLFTNSKVCAINVDDEYGKKLYDNFREKSITYGIDNTSDVYAKNIKITKDGNEFTLCYKEKEVEVTQHLPGKFNIYNALGCAATAIALNIPIQLVKEGIEKIVNVPGRSEKINTGKGFTIIIDYAHTPDGLINILNTAREYTNGRLISVFGCGGDRDKTKRPLMGRAAADISDFCVVTSDNPRTEDPVSIIEDIIPGVKQTSCPYTVIPDRRAAIEYAIHNAKENDVLVIAGKGHETYQILKDKTIHFDEREIVKEILQKM